MREIQDKFIDRLIAECRWVITRLMLDYENKAVEKFEQTGMAGLIANIGLLIGELERVPTYNSPNVLQLLEWYERIRNLLNKYGYNNQEILEDEYSKIRISDETVDALDRLFHLDIGILELEDFIE